MFDRLDDMLVRFEELLQELNDPHVVEDQNRFRKLMKEQTELAPVVEAYREYKAAKQDAEDSLSMLRRSATRKCAKCSRRSFPLPGKRPGRWQRR